jgi:hypothetical protein
MKVGEVLSMRFGQRWMMIFLIAIHCPAGAQPTVNPNDLAQLTPQLSQRLKVESFNPMLRKALRGAEHSACLLSLWYNGEGTIQAAQLIRTSGFPAIDQACFAAVMGEKLKPPALIQPELGGWVRRNLIHRFQRFTLVTHWICYHLTIRRERSLVARAAFAKCMSLCPRREMWMPSKSANRQDRRSWIGHALTQSTMHRSCLRRAKANRSWAQPTLYCFGDYRLPQVRRRHNAER